MKDEQKKVKRRKPNGRAPRKMDLWGGQKRGRKGRGERRRRAPAQVGYSTSYSCSSGSMFSRDLRQEQSDHDPPESIIPARHSMNKASAMATCPVQCNCGCRVKQNDACGSTGTLDELREGGGPWTLMPPKVPFYTYTTHGMASGEVEPHLGTWRGAEAEGALGATL